jgi:hypothetical protein
MTLAVCVFAHLPFYFDVMGANASPGSCMCTILDLPHHFDSDILFPAPSPLS